MGIVVFPSDPISLLTSLINSNLNRVPTYNVLWAPISYGHPIHLFLDATLAPSPLVATENGVITFQMFQCH